MSDRPSRFLDWLPFLWARVLFPGPQTAPTSGLVEFWDLFPPPGQSFYRSVQP